MGILTHENNLVIFPLDKENYQSANPKTSLLLPDNASYNVFPFPIEAPTFGSRSVVTNPWNPTASPKGGIPTERLTIQPLREITFLLIRIYMMMISLQV
ncbi:hypothetical protein [Chryseobacterium wanjuense]